MSTTSPGAPPEAAQRRPVSHVATMIPAMMHSAYARIGSGPRCHTHRATGSAYTPFNDLPHGHTRAEIGDAWKQIAVVTGTRPRYFRSPGGAWSTRIFDRIARWGMLPVD